MLVNHLLLFTLIFPQTNPILGTWLTEDKEAKVNIYYQNKRYYGKIVWLKHSTNDAGRPLTDLENPDKRKREQPLLNLIILHDFEYDEKEDEYISGKVYDTRNGKTYTGKLWMENNNTLKMRGYWGIFYATETWKRVE